MGLPFTFMQANDACKEALRKGDQQSMAVKELQDCKLEMASLLEGLSELVACPGRGSQLHENADVHIGISAKHNVCQPTKLATMSWQQKAAEVQRALQGLQSLKVWLCRSICKSLSIETGAKID